MATKHTKGVVDLTFHEIATDDDLSFLLRKALTEIRSPSKTTTTQHLAGTASQTLENGGATGSPGRRQKLEEITAVRLSNNLLTSMDTVAGPMIAAVDTSKILWMDLSFNKLTSVSGDFSQKFPNLTTIYAHANQISKLSEIKKFAAFPELKSLSLYGNPVEEHKHYKMFVLTMCPKLTQFDSSPVTRTERRRAEVWAQTFRRKLQPEEG